MLALFIVTATALFSVDNAKFIAQVEDNRNNGYEWKFVGKQVPQNKDYSVTWGDHIYFKQMKDVSK